MKLYLISAILMLLHLSTFAQITGIKISGDTCDNFTLDLQAIGTSSSPYFFWHFNDPASGLNDSITITGLSPSPFPTHTFTSPGVYNVCVSFQEPGMAISTICRSISIGLCCNGQINSPDSCLQNNISFSMTTGAVINSINWNFGDAASGLNNTSTSANPSHQFTSVGSYSVTATVNALCGVFTDTFEVAIVNCDTLPCTATIVVNDTCLNSSTNFQINSSYPILSINWNFDDPTSGPLNTAIGNNVSHQFTSSTAYSVKAIVQLNCGINTMNKDIHIIQCDSTTSNSCSLFIPNAFSPNGDNLNDIFTPITSCGYEKYQLMIYNRWGQLIFESSNPLIGWAGDYKGLNCPAGVYHYLLKYKLFNQQAEINKGDITLFK